MKTISTSVLFVMLVLVVKLIFQGMMLSHGFVAVSGDDFLRRLPDKPVASGWSG